MNVATGLTKGLNGGPAHFSVYSGMIRRGVVPLKSAANDNFGFGGGKASLDSIGAHIQDRNRHVVDSLSALIGTESVNIVVARALHLNGAMIANADKDENGVLTDHGHMTATIGKLFVQHIYDYDDGKTLAAAVSFAQNTKVKDKGGNAIDYFSLQGTFGSFDKDGYTRATLGRGDITIEQNPAELAKAHRDAATPQTFETQHNIKPTFFYYSNIDTKALIDAIPSSPLAWAKSVGTTLAETLGFGQFRETEEEKSKRLEKERIKKAVEEFERNHAQAQKEQQAMQEIDNALMTSQYADDYSGIGNERKRVSVVFLTNKVKSENPGVSTEKALDIARSVVHEAEQKLANDPAYEPASGIDVEFALGAGVAGMPFAVSCAMNPVCLAAVGGALLIVGGITLIQWAPQLKIKVLSTPIHENKGSILSTPTQKGKADREEFPVHEDKGSILSTPEHRGEADIEGFDTTPDWLRELNILYSVKVDKDGNMDLKGFDISNHEGGKHKGHTEEKHVQKSDEWLAKRLVRDKNIGAATTFKNKESANEVIKEVLERNKENIGKWMKNENIGGKEIVEHSFNEYIGHGINRGESSIESKTKVRVVLKKTTEGEFKIVTAYPIE